VSTPSASACYRLLAKEREWLIGTGAIEASRRLGLSVLNLMQPNKPMSD